MTQPTDEAAVDAEIFAAAWKAYEQWNEQDQPCPNDTIDCAAVAYIAIQNERAQLTAATRRAEQAEMMLAEAVKLLEPFAGHCDKRGETISLKWGTSTYTHTLRPDDFYDASEFIRSIRSAASGEQG